jgi:hypothetical protein
MHIDRVSYEKKFNLGNYENEVFSASCSVNEEEQDLISLIYAQLRKTVEDAHKAGIESRKEVDKK